MGRVEAQQQQPGDDRRATLGIEAKNASQASRLIKESLAAKVIKLFDPEARDRDRSYLPFWA